MRTQITKWADGIQWPPGPGALSPGPRAQNTGKLTKKSEWDSKKSNEWDRKKNDEGDSKKNNELDTKKNHEWERKG